MVPFGDLEALEQKIFKKDVAAFILEPIQGEGELLFLPRVIYPV